MRLVNGDCISTSTLLVVSLLKVLMADQVNYLEKVEITVVNVTSQLKISFLGGCEVLQLYYVL